LKDQEETKHEEIDKPETPLPKLDIQRKGLKALEAQELAVHVNLH